MQEDSCWKCRQPACAQAGPGNNVQSLTAEGSFAVAGRSCSLCHCPQLPPTQSPPQPHRKPARRAGAEHARPQQRVPAGSLKGREGRLCRQAHCANAAHAESSARSALHVGDGFPICLSEQGYCNPPLQAGQSFADKDLDGAACTVVLPKHSADRPNLCKSLHALVLQVLQALHTFHSRVCAIAVPEVPLP